MRRRGRGLFKHIPDGKVHPLSLFHDLAAGAETDDGFAREAKGEITFPSGVTAHPTILIVTLNMLNVPSQAVGTQLGGKHGVWIPTLLHK